MTTVIAALLLVRLNGIAMSRARNPMNRPVLLVAVLAALIVSFTAPAPDLLGQSNTTFSGSIRLRVEDWRWFETTGAEDAYTFFGAIARASATHRFNPRTEAQLELAAPMLLGLPSGAVAPPPRGQLGFGGTYFAANDNDTDVANLFVKQAWVRFGTPKLAVRAGRFELVDGMEATPADPLLATLKRTRVAHRLIGNFAFSHVGRSFDGLQLTSTPAPTWNATAALVRPTAGAFTVDGGEKLQDVGLVYGALTRTTARADMRLFVIGYQDDRDVVKTDNRPAAIRTADTGEVSIGTLGGHYLRTIPFAASTMDVLFWGALQDGTWGALDHEAHAGAVEAGWHRGGVSLRAGAFAGSGDGNPGDGQHGTFFQVLPTPRVYARLPFYNAMNSRDVFVAGSWKRGRWTLASELHRLRLHSSNDLWYSGGGAFEDRTFGFGGRPSGGRTDLAVVLDFGADFAMNPKTTISAYAATARGGDVVESTFAGDSASLVYLEVTRRF